MQSSKYDINHRIVRLPWPLSDRDLLYVSCGSWRFEGPSLVGVHYYTDWKRPAVGAFLSPSLRESSPSHPNPRLISHLAPPLLHFIRCLSSCTRIMQTETGYGNCLRASYAGSHGLVCLPVPGSSRRCIGNSSTIFTRSKVAWLNCMVRFFAYIYGNVCDGIPS